MKHLIAQDIIDRFKLQAHIEGGYFKEDFKSEIILPTDITGRGNRSLFTTCYYLIPKGDRSIFHKLAFDELWNFFCGGPVDFYEISEKGELTHTILGPDLCENQHCKHLVKKGTWFGVLPREGTEFAFFSAIVFPGFEYADWEKGDREFLKKLAPHASEIINKLT